MKKTDLKKVIDDFVAQCTEEFTFEELVAFLQTKTSKKIKSDTIFHILEDGEKLFNADEEFFTPRHAFFHKAVFMVSPTKDEVENGILFPGHRFHPFCSYEINPWDCTLAASGTKLATKTVKRKIDNLMQYYSLFGTMEFASYLVDDQPSNEKLFSSEMTGRELAPVRAFDFSAFFKQWNFTYGDAMLFTVEDWNKGIYSIEYLAQADRKKLEKKSNAWVQTLETGFAVCFDNWELDISMEEQIAWAYFYAGKSILKKPPMHLGGFIAQSTEVFIVDLAFDTALWFSDDPDDLPEGFIDNNDFNIDDFILDDCDMGDYDINDFQLKDLNLNDFDAQKSCGSIDSILSEMGMSLCQKEIEAYICDELYRRGNDPQAVLKRIFEGRTHLFVSKKQEDAFMSQYQELWQNTKNSYNIFADQRIAEIRAKHLALLDKHSAWLRNLDIQKLTPEELPLEEVFHLTQLFAIISDLLHILNTHTAKDNEIDESVILANISKLEEDIALSYSVIDKHLQKSQDMAKKQFKLIKGED